MALEEEWSDEPSVCVNGDHLRRIYDYFDESALETALKLKYALIAMGSAVRLSGLTIDSDLKSEKLCERLFAVGYDKITRIVCDDLLFAPHAKAKLLEKYIKSIPLPDVILLGMQSSIGGSGQTGPVLAEYLRLPCMTHVSKILPFLDKSLSVTCAADQETVNANIKGSAVLVIGNAAGSYMRVPTLKALMAVKGKQVETLTYSKVASYDVLPSKIYRKAPKPVCGFIEGSIEQKAQSLFAIIKGEKA